MANVVKNQVGVPENLTKQLAVAVRSIQWSYAIFWSLSATQQGEIQWGDGYYNGDIKTRKTVQALELKADKIGLQRSEQLRELYESLLEGETDQNKRPSAALSPEDLSDTEWYYLVCMSFVFTPGQGLPGKAFANGETIWLCNAQYADSKIFSRSLLAKSASIQTVVCFPYLGGVIELGVTQLVPEDPNLLQHIKASLLDFSKPVCSEKSTSAPHNADDDKDPICAKVDHEIVDLLDLENLYSPAKEIKFDHKRFNELHESIKEDFNISSPDECSNGFEQNHQMDDSFMLEDVNGVASQVQSWHFMDDDFSIQEKAAISSPKRGSVSHSHLKEFQQGNHTILSSLDLEVDDDLHYKRTVSAILSTSNWLIESPSFTTCGYKSSFIGWKKEGMENFHRPRLHQNIFKKILFAVPLMHRGKCSLGKLENNIDATGHVLPEKRREEEKFRVLKSIVPSIDEIDKESILKDTIKYLKELEARIEELESCKNSMEFEARPRRNCLDVVEQTSDNYENRKVDSVKKPWINKRKACAIDESLHESGSELNRTIPKDGLAPAVKVSIKELEVIIEIKCPCREFLLLDIMEAINNLHLDAHTVQSCTLDGLVTLTLKSKFRGAAIAPAGMIKQTLERVAAK
ncbi:Transcription factor GLABRA 3 -like protein [Gossypium arboreum]|uniref:Basic helix-loop-helix protein 123A n=1 Tax=Gossypium arboreum TaxID=29729 RepID=A0A0B0P3H4_GOSAR|nr:basic helix-loop-helix protein 123A [Gossypium arboreum]KHG17443.1 Transcription factor GLABRA 3 -like protein [Gossypium arboreum]KHG19610.1 Transcription factor GLABRA 3 -like protein [Gossypium arboreum]